MTAVLLILVPINVDEKEALAVFCLLTSNESFKAEVTHANLASNKEYQETLENLKKKMLDYLIETGDPRMKDPDTKVFMNTPYYAMQGIPTGGLFLKEWNTLDSLGKMEAIKTQYQAIDENKKKLENMGWDLTIIDDID